MRKQRQKTAFDSRSIMFCFFDRFRLKTENCPNFNILKGSWGIDDINDTRDIKSEHEPI